MKGNESQHLQVDSQSENSFGNKNFAFVLNFWNTFSNNFFCLMLALFKPLKRFQKLNIKSEVAFSIWKYETQVMTKK
jgi:hypothetical protein